MKDNPRPVKAILIVAPLGYAASIPFFMELVGSLAARGVSVTIVTVEGLDPPLDRLAGPVDVLHAEGRGRGLIRKMWRAVDLFRRVRRSLKERPDITHVFGLSQAGVVLAWLALLGGRRKLVYLNDELWYNDFGAERLYWVRKCLERTANERADLVITQDRDRGRLLAKINRLDPEKLAFLPNSRTGRARVWRTRAIHDLLGCPPDVKVVLWMGAATAGDGALEIAGQAVDWPPEYMFVYHFRSKSPSPYKQKLIELSGVGRNRYISNYFNYSDLERVYASAHIGVAYYPKRGINAEYIGLSSGKLNTFLKAGVPCIVSSNRGLAWAVREAGCVAIETMADFSSALSRLEKNYAERAKSAADAYNRLLSFDSGLEAILSRLEGDVQRRAAEGKSA